MTTIIYWFMFLVLTSQAFPLALYRKQALPRVLKSPFILLVCRWLRSVQGLFSAWPISGSCREFRHHFTEGKWITGRQYAAEMIRWNGWGTMGVFKGPQGQERDNSRSRSWKKETTEAKTIQLDQRKGTMQQVRGTLCAQILYSQFFFSMLTTR